MPRRQSQISRRSALLSGLGLAAGVSLAAAPAWASSPVVGPHPTADPTPTPARLTLPAPTGDLSVGTTSLHLVDTSRPDPWVPNVPFRELMVQLWYPAHDVDDHPRAPWLTPLTTVSTMVESTHSIRVNNPRTCSPSNRFPGGRVGSSALVCEACC